MSEAKKFTLQEFIKMAARLDDMDQLQRTLAADTNRAHIEAEKTGDGYLRRNFVRVFLAGIEGVSFVLKTCVIDTHEMVGLTLSKSEKAKLLELKLDEDGDAVRCSVCGVQKRYLGLADNFKFAWKMFAKVCLVDTCFPCDRPDFQYFLKAIEIRDRLMHPKSINDMTVTGQEMDEVGKARRWYVVNAALVLATCVTGYDKRFEEVFKKLHANRRTVQ